jgi:polyhydroxyalkanoate synthesis regulator phasin
MRELFDQWKAQQQAGPRLDKPVEDELWRRFTHARTDFDKTRRAWFAQLEQEQDAARREKERLVAQAEALSTSKDWAAGAGEFKRLMEAWRRAGRAQRATDDALWERFRTAQDQFFNAKDEVVAAERVQFEANLAVKEKLLSEAEALLPITDLATAKRHLRSVQDRWDEAGKVPRSDMQRVEGRLKKVEQAVRDAEDRRWKRSNPEVSARAQSMVQQLEKAVADLEAELATARSRGDDAGVAAAEQALAARQEWLASARAGLAD